MNRVERVEMRRSIWKRLRHTLIPSNVKLQSSFPPTHVVNLQKGTREKFDCVGI